ncbi:daunorubicin resistance protein DrrA family ABC transporter ATP-binding protein [Actinopolyspora erythraea]|uniref:Daunorubicin resistance protein DrrA family ABC transporter ATP-binding protein n=1 Tax=Actinopolyspora erythraea TaxID=414996 RepID=A0A223RXN1_9ACTN|nr:daunorubicin resistance protein DrrA family ABC transporter ATP-binding protein [Actinopolyspora erythraea]ASU80625.1 daunorubicin resistance protein DrrA family ABC transporter ATP-binding protein [Actinopolyspora erythraea]
MTSTAAISAESLVKTFGSNRALDGVELRAQRGRVLGLLGPNGAGKTTAVRILTTLLRPDSGSVSVAGHDVLTEPDAVRRSIGVSGQYAAVDENLTGRENLYMVGRLYGMSRAAARERAGQLLDGFRLLEAGDRVAKGYSGGMRRRLDLAGALVARPPVVMLDEPTTGLDPRGRMDTWQLIAELVDDGTTVLLTTQYLEEADALADTIAVIDHGRVIANGTSDELKARVGGERLELVVDERDELETASEVLARVGSGVPRTDARTRRVQVAVSDGSRALVEAVRGLDALGIEVHDVGLHRPTLDDAFLSLTGKHAEPPDNGRNGEDLQEPEGPTAESAGRGGRQ